MNKALWANGLALTAAALLASAGTANASLATVIGSDSTFKVGIDIQPGVYKTTTATQLCAWARLSSLSGGTGGTIEAGGAVGGNATVTIKSTDVAFFTSGCGTWTLDTTTTVSGSSNFSTGSIGGFLPTGSASGSSH
ncbi:hypothetical protein ACFXO9_24270 [Nocardia tengchongensis]|uniref:Uncharacterized protein n=1 Tax=Nocardia tengchongensis TaxID=2055889 RepID=A0ABX8CJI1_9NOCA|nr:hypothetical protein [Nocardia tengchongensis]QVI20126.1 hypothetical protein KHQ06_28325 [Nocardia tengchongensis]